MTWRNLLGAAAILLAAPLLAARGEGQTSPSPKTLYKDAKAPISSRVNDLLRRMTLAEKIAQLRVVWQTKPAIFDANMQFDAAKAAAVYPDGIGGLARPSDLKGPASPRLEPLRNARATVALTNAMQHWAVEHTRLGIPVLFHEEGLHGYVSADTTSFPIPIGLASSFDPDMVRQVNAVTAREIRIRGIHQVLSPVVDVARDPRWGRIEETFGEDPYLVGEMGVAAVQGLQGNGVTLTDGKVFATLKHLTGHGQPESGTNTGPAEISERTLRENFFPPFAEVVRRTGIRAVMASYNEIDGIPSHANYWLLHDILRGEWGFKGAVVSDYEGIEQLADLHHVEPDQAHAAARALHAGVDMDLPDGVAYATLVQSVKAGLVAQKDIDTAVRRILTLKFEAGLFEHPFADGEAAERLTGNAEARALALAAAREVPVLLKNDGTLPLNPARIKTLAVIGPNAAAARLGGYTGTPRQIVTMLDGIRARAGSGIRVITALGVKITQDDDWWADKVSLPDRSENEALIRQAVETARTADQIVLVLGDTEQTSREGWADSHLGDRDSLDLVGQQDELADAIFALGKPVVVVLLNGRPLSVNNVTAKANALVEGWYLGQEGGTAMAEILFGDVNPSGHLPVTIPRSVGQLPMFYNFKPSAHRGYLFDAATPLFPFGYGLSYTNFEIGAPRLSAPDIAPGESVTVQVDVRNSGARAGDAVVQLYIRDKVSSVTRPVKELKGFRRVSLNPGETRTASFTLGPRELGFWNEQMKRVVEPGEFEIMAGDSSVNLKTTLLNVSRASRKNR
jgi:beta-glucosidase